MSEQPNIRTLSTGEAVEREFTVLGLKEKFSYDEIIAPRDAKGNIVNLTNDEPEEEATPEVTQEVTPEPTVETAPTVEEVVSAVEPTVTQEVTPEVVVDTPHASDANADTPAVEPAATGATEVTPDA